MKADTTSTTRRAVLAGAAVHDPILAAINEARALFKVCDRLSDAIERAELRAKRSRAIGHGR